MIQVIIPKTSLDKAVEIIQDKVDQIAYVASPTAKTEIGKAVFSITAKKFIRDLSAAAISDPKKFHHIYEWNRVGDPSQKLFIIKRASVQYGNIRVEMVSRPSRTPVPIPQALSQPGPTGKFVKAQSIFRNKMDVMEAGEPVVFTAQRTLVFTVDKENLVFVSPGTVINIMHPGGAATKGSFHEFAQSWYSMKAPIAIAESNLVKEIGNRVAEEVNKKGSTKTSVLAAIKEISYKYGGEIAEL
jgi:hypothetical protein